MRRLAFGLSAVAVLSVLGAVPATAVQRPDPVFVTVHLATDEPAIARLAHTSGLSHRARLTRLRAAVARPAVQRAVVHFLQSHGLAVTSASPFAVTARASRAAADALFPHRGSTGRRSLGGLAGASFVTTSSDGAGLLKPLVTLDGVTGDSARLLYSAPDGVPPTGATSPTIATLQFSGWNAGDLSTYAVDHGLPDPVASGQYAAVSVDGADPTLLDGSSGEIEVALDQESLLATAPHASQSAYFAPNAVGSMVDAIEQVAADAYNGATIGALSISYGFCETDVPANVLSDVHHAIADAVAVGVTVFAATGDSGAFGCGPGVVGVSYPASDPLVVGVGGTTVLAATPTPSETVWWDGTSGGGGGVSAVYPEPAYQSSRASGLGGRGVPDIALDGDPASGFDVDVDGLTGRIGGTSLASPLAAATFTDLLASSGMQYGIGDIHRNLYGAPATAFRDITLGDNGQFAAGPGYDAASGLGSPLWGALRNSLIGLPNLHTPSLWGSRLVPIKATAPAGMVYAGWSIGTGSEPSACGTPTSAGPPTSVRTPADGRVNIYVVGYTASGNCYISDATTRVDSVAPVAHASATWKVAKPGSVNYVWSAHDASPSSGLKSYRVRISRVGSSGFLYKQDATTLHGVTLGHAVRGATYVLTVAARDVAGHLSPAVTSRVTVPKR